MSNRYIKDGKVAVLYSADFGAGWSTWAGHYSMAHDWRRAMLEYLLMDSELVECVLSARIEAIGPIVHSRYPDVYFGGLRDIAIAWVPVGSRFEVTEYDGRETVSVYSPDDYFTA